MSYEGYDQYICENGHYWIEDCYSAGDPAGRRCKVCSSKVAWRNGVDQTNGSWDDDGNRIDGHVELEVDIPALECTCPTCGHTHTTTVETYKIPENKGWKTDGEKDI